MFSLILDIASECIFLPKANKIIDGKENMCKLLKNKNNDNNSPIGTVSLKFE
tara:strand:+ start:947 stop:1102 length:156 start_codon:yes stop_codon:yes gene_type:complete